MAAETLKTDEIIAAIGVAVSELTKVLSTVKEEKANAIPYEGSWTPLQLLIHITKSINGMAKAMQMHGTPAERDPGERIEELRSIFLDFSTKMQSGEFTTPEPGIYEIQPIIDKLNDAFKHFQENVNNAHLDYIVEGLPFGPITKLEIVYFTLFHTQRHLHQMRKICEALK